MVLAFKTDFVSKILEGSKIHTIREDKTNRWCPKTTIHFATGVRTKNYNQFFEGQCISVQDIQILYPPLARFPVVLVDGNKLSTTQLSSLAKNDGFDSFAKLTEWFDKDFKGKLIHWTDFKY